MSARNRRKRYIARERALFLIEQVRATRAVRHAAISNASPEARLMAAVFGLHSPIGIEQGRIPNVERTDV